MSPEKVRRRAANGPRTHGLDEYCKANGQSGNLGKIIDRFGDCLQLLVAQVQQSKMEPEAVEVKAAAKGTPKVYDSLSAFANRPGGGVILFGLDESQDFKIVGICDPQRI